MDSVTRSREPTELQIFKVVLYHCLFIIVLPVLSFFTTKIFIFDALVGMNSVASNVYAAVIAIIVLHFALGAFIYRAYFGLKKVPEKKD